jgi:glycosyltransferase involved in cell wall biosynthesis
MKILFVVHQFPPLNKIGTFRIYSFVKEWLKMGHKITILTTKKYTFDGDLNYFPSELEHENLKIIEVEYATWFTKKFENKIGIPKKNNKGSKLTQIKSLVRVLRRYVIGANFDIHNLWISNAYKKGKKLLDEEEYNVVLSSFFPPSSHIVASKLKQEFPNLFWVADYRDLWSGNHLTGGNFIANLLIKYKEKKIIKNANILVTVSEPLKQYLELNFSKKTFVIENGFDTEEIEALEKRKLFPNDGVTRIVYTGSLYYKRRDPTPLFIAVRRLEAEALINKENFRIIFYGDKNFIENLAKDAEVEDYIDIKGYVPKEESLKAQRDASALMFLEYENLEDTDLSSKGVLTGKLFEYLASGTEIIGIGITNKSLAGNLIEKSNMGKCYYNNSDEIYKALKRIIISGKKIMKPNRSILENYTRSKKAKQLINIINKEIKF